MSPETLELIQNPAWLGLLNDIVTGALLLALGLGMAILSLKAWRYLRRLWAQKDEPKPAQELSPEIPEIQLNLASLSKILAELEKDGSKASILLCDAKVYTQALVSLVSAISLKSDSMAEEAHGLQQALEAIASRDPLQIAGGAGLVKDDHIRALMLARVKNSDYWQDVGMLINTQIGALSLWEQSYRQFSSNLISEVSQAKSRLASGSAALELLGAGRPLLEAQANLSQAQALLQIERKPGLHRAAKALPALNAGLLR